MRGYDLCFQKQPPEMVFFKEKLLKNFALFTGNVLESLFVKAAGRKLNTYLEKHLRKAASMVF